MNNRDAEWYVNRGGSFSLGSSAPTLMLKEVGCGKIWNFKSGAWLNADLFVGILFQA